MTRLKECVYRIYKLNYQSIRTIMDGQRPDVITIGPKIQNKLNH
jgi:hypothetical protein